ncbi:hypothetical protein VNO77_42185 [Canavalia gladiata]|uniref:MADS-box domain-containing protein n=1 Tax=Canavalia gladiata TaxID=3824 RepID=A0AAN9PSL7_CANGL
MATKPSTRKRKTEIKKVEQRSKRHVTFSKRKLGLFNKLTELSILCQSQTALIITSQNGKLYSCGYPDVNAVVRRYLAGGSPQCESIKKQRELIDTLRLEYETTQNHLQEEKNRLQNIKEAQENRFGFPSWWNQSIDDMDLENLEQFKDSLELLKLSLVAAMQKDKSMSFTPMPVTVVPPPQLPNFSLPNQRFDEHQVQDYWGNGATTSSFEFPINGFDNY